MAFIYLRRSRNTRNYLLIESYRDDQGRTRKRTLCYLGREQDGTDTLDKALTHWKKVRVTLNREIRSAKGERRKVLKHRLAAAEDRIGVISEHVARQAQRAAAAEAARRSVSKRSRNSRIGRPSIGCAAIRRRKMPGKPSGRFGGWRSAIIPTRAAPIRASCGSRTHMTGHLLDGRRLHRAHRWRHYFGQASALYGSITVIETPNRAEGNVCTRRCDKGGLRSTGRAVCVHRR